MKLNENSKTILVAILKDKKDNELSDESIIEIKKRLGGLSDSQLITALILRLGDYYNSYVREIKKNEELEKQNHEMKSINKMLQSQCGMGNGRLQVEKAKQGIAIKKKIPFDIDYYLDLKANGLTNKEIAYRMGMSLSTLRRNLKDNKSVQNIKLSI